MFKKSHHILRVLLITSALAIILPVTLQIRSAAIVQCELSAPELRTTLEHAADLLDSSMNGDTQLAALNALRHVRTSIAEYRSDCVPISSLLVATGQLAGLPAVSHQQTATPSSTPGLNQTATATPPGFCPPEGRGGDSALNMKKNRVDEPPGNNYLTIEFASLINLPWPREIEKRHITTWPPTAQAEIALAEGLPVRIEGFLADAEKQGGEATNCASGIDNPPAANSDVHIWLIDHPIAGSSAADARSLARAEAIVVETTPRIHTHHNCWNPDRLKRLARDGIQVRISGWTMFDYEHPEFLYRTRGTLWEIHPVTQIDVRTENNANWIPLDSFDMGSSLQC